MTEKTLDSHMDHAFAQLDEALHGLIKDNLAGAKETVNKRQLDEALYAFNERGMWGDIELDMETVLRAWALVERVREHGFPRELQM